MTSPNKIEAIIKSLGHKPCGHKSILVLLDDISPTPSTYLACCAQDISPENISFLVNNGRGLIFAALSSTRAKELGLNYLTPSGSSLLDCMTVSVEARFGVSTGISCADRAVTLNVLSSTKDAKQDLVTPGHIFPLVAKLGGVIVKTSAVELAVDLCKLSKLAPVSALTQCLDANGKLLNLAQGIELATQLELNYVSISEMVNYRLQREKIIELVESTKLSGNLELHKFKSTVEGGENHFAITLNSKLFSTQSSVIVRVQSEDLFNDLFALDQGKRRAKTKASMQAINAANCGAFVYIRHPKRANNKTMDQLRELGIGAQLLKTLGIEKISLLGASDKIFSGISAFGIDITERISI